MHKLYTLSLCAFNTNKHVNLINISLSKVYNADNATEGAYMRRMRNGTVYMELNQVSKDRGYTMRSVINSDAIRKAKR